VGRRAELVASSGLSARWAGGVRPRPGRPEALGAPTAGLSGPEGSVSVGDAPDPLPAFERVRPLPPRRRLDAPPPELAPSLLPRWDSFCLEEGWPPRPLPGGGDTTSGALGKDGAGLESPIFGLTGASGTLAPSAEEGANSGLRAPAAASGASGARLGASGAAAGRPVVGSNIGEIPSPGRAGMRRRRHSSGCATESRLSGALRRVAEIDSESTFFVVSFARIREYRGDVTVGDSEEDEAGHDRDG